jgi:hypothetical protein
MQIVEPVMPGAEREDLALGERDHVRAAFGQLESPLAAVTHMARASRLTPLNLDHSGAHVETPAPTGMGGDG